MLCSSPIVSSALAICFSRYSIVSTKSTMFAPSSTITIFSSKSLTFPLYCFDSLPPPPPLSITLPRATMNP